MRRGLLFVYVVFVGAEALRDMSGSILFLLVVFRNGK